MALKTPLGWAADRWSLGPRSLRWATSAALVVSILIILTGGVVRVTGSGLGCPTWPACSSTAVIAPVSSDLHQVIEQTNRLITGVVIVAVGWVIVAARLQRPRDRRVTRLAWSQFWLVIANAVVGGVSVLAQLNPWVVAAHFVMALALLTTTTLTWHVARSGPRVRANRDGRGYTTTFPETIRTTPAARVTSWVLAVAAALLVLVGTLVSGAGPHSGDSSDVPRIPIPWLDVTVVHGCLAAAVLALAVALWLQLRGPEARVPRLRTSVLIAVLLGQGAVGVVQSLTHLPEWLVAVHLLGAALTWAGTLRVLLDVNPRPVDFSSKANRTIAAAALDS